MMEMNIAILGAPGVGKSTFIQHAFGARQPPTTAVQSRRVSIGDAVCIIRLVELSLGSIELADNGEVRWPKFVDGQPTPIFHGAMTLYDIKNRDSLSMIPDVLSESSLLLSSIEFGKRCSMTLEEGFTWFSPWQNYLEVFLNAPSHLQAVPALSVEAIVLTRNSASDGLMDADIPCILVSCKCDGPSGARQINPNKIEQAGIILSGVECFQTSADSPDTQKRCLNAVAKAIKMGRTEEMKPLGVRQRSNSISQREQPMSPQPRGQQGSRHSRASSEQAALGQKSPGVKDASQYPNDGVTRRSSRSNGSKSSAHRVSSRSGSNSAKPGQRQGDPRHASQNGLGLTMVSDAPFKSSAGTRVVESFLDMDDEKDDAYPDIDDVPLLDRRDNESIMEKPAKATGDTLEDLVDRLLGQPLSKADTNFGTTFLCLYRKFATPGKLLDSIIRRFDSTESEEASYMSRISSQLRHVGVLVRWTTDYPGDFAHPHTRNRLGSFMSRIATKRVFAVAVQQMRANLDAAIEDEDGIWAMADSDHNRDYSEITDSFLSTTSSVRSSIATISAPSGSDDLERQLSAMTADTEETLLGSPTTSNARSTGASNITIISTGSSQTLPTSVEAAEREAQLLLPTPRTHLTKLQWHAFMETSDEDIATELTRIDWIMFSAIRPRDLIRHVSLPADKKETCKSVENVNRMINHFNHVAYWVANMILLRDKPKHRAQALEKFMSVAWVKDSLWLLISFLDG